jgi:hypothetical protein
MDCLSNPDPRSERIAQAEERLRAAALRMSQAQELVIVAKQRLALARLALQESRAYDAHDPAGDAAAERNARAEDDSGAT